MATVARHMDCDTGTLGLRHVKGGLKCLGRAFPRGPFHSK